MRQTRRHQVYFGLLALLGASGGAWGQQCISSLEGTGATSVLNASGQGNFACADMSPGPNGGGMRQLTGVSLVIRNAAGTPVTTGTEVDITVPANALPGSEIDAVYIRANGNGARCLYSFSDYSASATGLQSGGDAFDAADVIVCSDGVGTPPPVEPVIIEPISTASDACDGVINTGGNPVAGLDLVTGVSLDGQTLAVCNTDGSEQFQCVDLCKNLLDRTETQACIDANALLSNGEVSLDCAPCDLANPSAPPATDQDGNPLFYCWEYTNSVVREPPLSTTLYPNAPGTDVIPGTTTPRTAGTMLPHKSTFSSAQEYETFNYTCYKTTTKLNGLPYTYTTCR